MMYVVLGVFALSAGCLILDVETEDWGAWAFCANLVVYFGASVWSLVQYFRSKRKARLAPVFWVGLGLGAAMALAFLLGSCVIFGPVDIKEVATTKVSMDPFTVWDHPSLIGRLSSELWLRGELVGRIALGVGIVLPLLVLLSIRGFWRASARSSRDKASLIGLIFAAFLTFWLKTYDVTPAPPQLDVARDFFGGKQYFTVVRSAQKAMATRLKMKEKWDNTVLELDRYERGESVVLSAEQIVLVKKLLAERSKYEHWPAWMRTESGWGYMMPPDCAPDYGVMISFPGEAAPVNVAFCFQCGIVGVFDGSRPLQESGFSPMRAEMVVLFKALFRSDPVIQKLE